MRLPARAMGLGSVLVLAACSMAVTPPAGSERGPCYGNGTCDAPLICLSDLCVRATGGVDDAGADVDGGGLDAAIVADAGPRERRTYVASSIFVPTNASTVAMLGRDLDGDGVVDNAIGQLFSALASAGVSSDPNAATQTAVDRGDVILLFDAQAASFTDGTADARALEGASPTPTPCTDPTMPATCGQHLLGTGHFTVVTPAPALLGGSLTGSRLTVGPGASVIPLTFSSTPVWVPIVATRLEADVSATDLMHGVFAGAIRSADVDATVIPAMHAPIAAAVTRDCSGGSCISGSEGATYASLFDADHDGAVTLDEFRTNSLIQTLLQLDLDLFDATGAAGTDGVPDAMSVGLGFTAVAATFTAP